MFLLKRNRYGGYPVENALHTPSPNQPKGTHCQLLGSELDSSFRSGQGETNNVDPGLIPAFFSWYFWGNLVSMVKTFLVEGRHDTLKKRVMLTRDLSRTRPIIRGANTLQKWSESNHYKELDTPRSKSTRGLFIRG